MTVGSRIKEVRKHRSYTQKALGVLSDMSEAMIRQYELGLRNPKLESLEKIAEALGCSVEYLKHGTGNRPRPNIEIKEFGGDEVSTAGQYYLYSCIDKSELAHYMFFKISDGKTMLTNCDEEVRQVKSIETILTKADIPATEKDRLMLEICNALFKGKAESMTTIYPSGKDDEDIIKMRKLLDMLFEEREIFWKTEGKKKASPISDEAVPETSGDTEQ